MFLLESTFSQTCVFKLVKAWLGFANLILESGFHPIAKLLELNPQKGLGFEDSTPVSKRQGRSRAVFLGVFLSSCLWPNRQKEARVLSAR